MICGINVHRSLKLCDPRDPKMTDALCARFFSLAVMSTTATAMAPPEIHDVPATSMADLASEPSSAKSASASGAYACVCGGRRRPVRIDTLWACSPAAPLARLLRCPRCALGQTQRTRTRTLCSCAVVQLCSWVVRERRVIVHGCSELFLDRHVELELLSQLLCQV